MLNKLLMEISAKADNVSKIDLNDAMEKVKLLNV